eukprot:4160868-Amphidinium_carterae.1
MIASPASDQSSHGGGWRVALRSKLDCPAPLRWLGTTGPGPSRLPPSQTSVPADPVSKLGSSTKRPSTFSN